MAKTQLFFTTDIHGSDVCFRKFINAGKAYEADVLVLGGDITGKMIIPIVEQDDGSYKAEYLGSELILKTKEELAALEKNIKLIGAYFCHSNENEISEFRQDESKIKKLFEKLIRERIEEWVVLAEERLAGTNIKCIINPGNDDAYFIDDILKKSDIIIVPEGKNIQIDEYHEMISTGYSNITPWHCDRDIPEKEIEKKIDEMVSQVNDMENCIFNFHCPPFDAVIDYAPLLDENMKPVLTAGGEPEMIPVGCKAVRSAIEKYQPLYGLHGHIHESKGFTRIGRTICLNPGSEYGEGVVRGVILVLHKKTQKCKWMFTEG
jgi:Icc-related predicted phosphoesterase